MKTNKQLLRFTGLICSIMALGYAFNAHGATVTILVGSGGLVFSPATSNIALHDSVIWSWSGLFHSTTSGNGTASGLWDSGVNNAPHSFTNTFNSPGSFPYYCTTHFSLGMKGTIIVSAPNNPPAVTLTNPANGTTLGAPAAFTLAANATDADGSVTNVKFLQGTTVLGNVTANPFSIPVTNLPLADHTFSAIASDNGGLTATNSITIHVIAANPVVISALAFSPPNHFQFSYSADVGLTYVLQVSSNLLDWNSLLTNTANTSPMVFTNTNASGSNAFYRVGRLPNP